MYQDHHIYYCEFSLNITLYNWIPPYLSFPSTFLLCLIYNDPKFYFFQIMITSKTFVKHITVESFVTSGVSQLVYFKITRSSKAFVTYFTHKRLFSSVKKWVSFKFVFCMLRLKSHYSQLNGLSPVWINSWLCRIIDVVKHLSHTLHLKCLFEDYKLVDRGNRTLYLGIDDTVLYYWAISPPLRSISSAKWQQSLRARDQISHCRAVRIPYRMNP